MDDKYMHEIACREGEETGQNAGEERGAEHWETKKKGVLRRESEEDFTETIEKKQTEKF